LTEETNKIRVFIDKLQERKVFLLDKKKKVDAELKEIDKKLKKHIDRIKKREIEETIILADKVNLSITDIKKILATGNTDKLKEMLKEKED
jgi:hypothetical protein